MALKHVDNMEINEQENTVLLSINPKIYPLEVVYAAAYVLMDRAYVVLDGDPASEVIVTLRPKKEAGLEGLARDFNEELVNYAVNLSLARKGRPVQEELVKKALFTHSQK